MLPAILKHTALARTEAHHLFCFSLCMLNYSFVCGANYNPSNMANWRVRDAVAEDVPDILRMIKVMKSASTFHCFHLLGQINLTAGHLISPVRGS